MAKTARRKVEAEPTQRLSAEDWIRAGIEILSEQGIEAVRVEPLARMLKVTKGSFYWHFSDRAALQQEMLDFWRKRTTLLIIERLEHSSQTPQERLRALMNLAYGGPKSDYSAVELAIRLWGRSDAKARETLAEVDELRIKYFTRLIVATGVPQKEAVARAVLAYSYVRVAASLPPTSNPPLSAIENILFPN